jgi:basic membrane protein A
MASQTPRGAHRLLLALLFVMAAIASACGSDGDSSETADDAPAAAEDDTADDGATDGASATEGLEVRVLTNQPTDAGLWDPLHYAVYTEVADELGANLEIAEAVQYGEADQVLDRWGEEGVALVFSTDNGFEEHLLRAAENYPDTNWVMMSALSTTNELDNIAAYSVNWCDLGFAVGAAAAVASESGRIGHVGAIPILPQDQYVSGAAFGAAEVNPDATVTNRDTGDFIDVAKAQETASALLGDGNDVLITFQGLSSREIARRAQEEGAHFVGFMADHEEFAPDAVVTSVAIDFTGGYREAIEATAAGSLDAAIQIKSFDEGFLQVLPLRLGFEGEAETIDALVTQLMDGALTYPDGACSGVTPGSQAL